MTGNNSRIGGMGPINYPTTFTGEGGPATNVPLLADGYLGIDPAGNVFYTDPYDARVVRIDAATNTLTTVAGNGNVDSSAVYQNRVNEGAGGPAALAWLRNPRGLTSDSLGNLYIADQEHLKKISADTGIISSLAGTGSPGDAGDGGPATQAQIAVYPTGSLTRDSAGNLYFINAMSSADPLTEVRRISAETGIITTIAGHGLNAWPYADGKPATSASLTGASELLASGTDLFLTDALGNIRKIDLTTGIITTVAASTRARALDRDANGVIYFTSGDSVGKFDPSTGRITTIAGKYANCTGGCSWYTIGLLTGEQLGDGGLAANATLNGPRSVKVDRSGNLYIADTDNHRVRFNSAETGIISTFAGSNTWGCSQGAGPIGGALFASPFRLELKPDGSVYVLDSNCGQLYKLTPYLGGIDSLDCQTLAGWATDASRAGQAIPVNIYSDGSLLATVTADQPAAVNGLHGFSWALPDSLFDSVTHTIRVTYDGTGIDLPGSPTYSTCDPLPVEGQAKRRNR